MKQYDTSRFESGLKEWNIFLTGTQRNQYLRYYELLTEWNAYMNLTAITEFEEVMQKHFADSLSLVKAVDLSKPLSVLDVGTGAGFPGLALKIAFPQLKITLLDSLNKRVTFLKEVIDSLELTGVEALHGRAEDYAKPGQLREQYDLCVSRAVANLTTLCELCLPFVKVGGSFVSYKSDKVEEELTVAESAVALLGAQVKRQEVFLLPDSEIHRHLLVFEKIKETPRKYPRKAGLPSREPLH